MEKRNRHLLIIENDDEMRGMLEDFLKEEGYRVTSAQDGCAAIPIVSGQGFDLVITDIRMPGMNGLEVLLGIKQRQPHTPVIVLTAFGSEEVQRRAFSRGATLYLEKPISLELLGKVVRNTLGERQDNDVA